MTFGFPCLTARAADSVTLTPAQTRALFGDSIVFDYFDGTDYRTDAFTYQNPNTVPTELYEMGRGSRDVWDALHGQTSRYVLYRTTTAIPTAADPYFTVRIRPSVNLSGISDLDMMFGISTPVIYTDGELVSVATQRTTETTWGGTYRLNGDIYPNMFSFSTSLSPTAQMNYWGWQEFQSGTWKQPFLLTALRVHTQDWSLLSDIDIMRNGPVTRGEFDSGNTYFLIQCPTLSATYSNDPNYSPGNDLTSTNIKLDVIISNLNRIAAGLDGVSQQLDGIADTLQDIADRQEDDDGSSPENDAAAYDTPSGVSGAVGDAISGANRQLADSSADIDLSDANGLLAIVWRFIQRAHLDSIFAAVALIAVVRWVIFK